MTPTQPSQAVEAAEREKFERSALTRHLDKSIGKDAWDRPQYTAPHVESLWAGWLARSALASQQEVAAPVGDAPTRCGNCGKPYVEGDNYITEGDPEGEFFCSVECHEQHNELGCPHEHHNGYRHPAEAQRLIDCENALRSLASWLGAGGYNAPQVDAKVFEEKIRWGVDHLTAASRVPVASPAEPVGFIAKETLADLQNTDWQMQRNTPANLWTINNPPSRAVIPVYATPPVGAGGAGVMDARPDSFHSGSGECDRVQGLGPTDAERYRFLAERCRSSSEHWGGRWSIIIEGPCPTSHDSEDDFDAAIDAAILASKGGAA